VISRSGLETNGAEGGGYLQPGDWTVSTAYRHVYSHVHFSGPTENVSRAQLGTEVQSKTNLADLMFTYQVTPRFSLQATIPVLWASRRQQAQYGTLYTSGIGDISFGGQYWLRSPKSERSGFNNVQFSLGLLVPTGKSRIENNVATSYGASPTTQYPDYSVQPGGGSWGAIYGWQAFQSLGNQTIAFFDGTYVMSQGGQQDFWTSHGGTSNAPPVPTKGLTQFDAIQDQYMLEVGLSHPAPKIPGLGLTLSLRDEGVPAHDLIGNNLGFRRPGFGIALTPGFIYTHGNNMVQFSVGKLLVRDRTRSVAEEVNGVRAGDAAFANYVWMAAWTVKKPAKRSVVDVVPQISSARPPATSVTPAAGAPATVAATPAKEPDSFKPFNLRTLDGKKKTLKDVSGKVTVVNFFYPRCPYCQLELPEMQKLYDNYKDKGLSVVWINILPEEVSLIAGWQFAKNFTVPVLIGGSQAALQKDYQVEATPTTYVLGEKGEVLFYEGGYTPGDERKVEAKIAAALGIANPISISTTP
jgi:thiol-disulfide isomerase/thioredoxin